jgi:hypothetical protein
MHSSILGYFYALDYSNFAVSCQIKIDQENKIDLHYIYGKARPVFECKIIAFENLGV